MFSSCPFRWSCACQTLAVNARNRAKTTKIKSDVLETLVILMPDFLKRSLPVRRGIQQKEAVSVQRGHPQRGSGKTRWKHSEVAPFSWLSLCFTLSPFWVSLGTPPRTRELQGNLSSNLLSDSASVKHAIPSQALKGSWTAPPCGPSSLQHHLVYRHSTASFQENHALVKGECGRLLVFIWAFVEVVFLETLCSRHGK